MARIPESPFQKFWRENEGLFQFKSQTEEVRVKAYASEAFNQAHAEVERKTTLIEIKDIQLGKLERTIKRLEARITQLEEKNYNENKHKVFLLPNRRKSPVRVGASLGVARSIPAPGVSYEAGK